MLDSMLIEPLVDRIKELASQINQLIEEYEKDEDTLTLEQRTIRASSILILKTKMDAYHDCINLAFKVKSSNGVIDSINESLKQMGLDSELIIK